MVPQWVHKGKVNIFTGSHFTIRRRPPLQRKLISIPHHRGTKKKKIENKNNFQHFALALHYWQQFHHGRNYPEI